MLIKEQCRKYREAGFEVFCPDLLGRPPFLYEEANVAYDFFVQKVGFQVYEKINKMIFQLKEGYDKVFLIGFSVGATIAWRCCENTLCSGIVACYGSRIRDYTNLCPSCPTFLLFAKEDSFQVSETISELKGTPNLLLAEMEAKHGFMDLYSENYEHQIAEAADKTITEFFHSFTN